MPVAKPIHIVDDDSGFLKGIARLLSAHGLTVKTFASAEEFQARADPDEAACLVLDIHLGAVSGIDLMRDLSRCGTRTPVVLITGNDNERMRRMAVASGCSAFLRKPVSARTLIGAVNEAIARAPDPS